MSSWFLRVVEALSVRTSRVARLELEDISNWIVEAESSSSIEMNRS